MEEEFVLLSDERVKKLEAQLSKVEKERDAALNKLKISNKLVYTSFLDTKTIIQPKESFGPIKLYDCRNPSAPPVEEVVFPSSMYHAKVKIHYFPKELENFTMETGSNLMQTKWKMSDPIKSFDGLEIYEETCDLYDMNLDPDAPRIEEHATDREPFFCVWLQNITDQPATLAFDKMVLLFDILY